MLTNPNTLGLFDENIREIARDRPRGGRDAVLRRRQPERDHGALEARRHGLRHRPRQPPQVVLPAARRRRPRLGADRGLGPDRALPARPARRRGASGGDGAAPTFDLDYERPKSIGRLRGFQGNFGVFVRSYAYILSLGGDGLAEASETAVLNANYLLARLREGRAGKYLPVAFDRRCMHEFVLSGRPAKRELKVDDARRRQAAARLRVPSPDDLLPAARRGGADGRADRDRDARNRSTRSPTRSRRSSPRPSAIPRRCARRPTRRRSAASTRPRRRGDPVVRQPLD